MTSKAEDVLFASLSDVNRMDVIARDGFPLKVIPTEDMRQVVEWAIERYYESGRTTAPSVAAIEETWAPVLDHEEIELSDGTEIEDTIEWAIEQLKSTYAYKQSQVFSMDFASQMSSAAAPDRLSVLASAAEQLYTLSLDLTSKSQQVEGVMGFSQALDRYDLREATGRQTMGMTFGRGLSKIDQHTYGIHAGELAIVAAGPKVGKSYWCAYVALNEWLAGRRVVLFTLENSIDMTIDRMACLHLGLDPRRWSQGQATEAEKLRVRTFHSEVSDLQDKLHVLRPAPGQRSVQAMVRTAQMLDAESLIIDQLTFVEPVDERAPRVMQIRQMTHDLKSLVSGKYQMACLVAHQINREGVKSANRVGYLEMFHLAEGSEVERTADMVCSLYQSDDARIAKEALFQILAFRREDIKAWNLQWNIGTGLVSADEEVILGGSGGAPTPAG